jgi:phage terminase large subunit GpA-like protein
MTDIFTNEKRKDSLEWFIELFNSAPTHIERVKVSEWAEEHRTLSEGLTPYPGPYSFDICPYMREIVDSLSESSPVHEVAVMKGTQIMFTVGSIENWIGYTIDIAPGPMLYVTGDAGLADTQMELRIDSMINNSGIAHKIGAQSRREGQRKTGDIKTRKEFPGGFLVAAGPNSGAKLRSMSFKKVNVDEVDAFPDSTGKEGDPIYLIRRRVDAFSESYKILWGSTPLFKHNSKIYSLYKEGDQRKYFVPCKKCGHMQYLRWGNKNEPGGLRFEYTDDYRLVAKYNKDGQITESSVYYECEKCGAKWKNSDKDWFLPRGEWRPTADPRRPGMRSYHIPGLLSPVGFRSWENAVIEFLQIKSEGKPKLKMQNWVNTFLGEPFEDYGGRPKIEALVSREKEYKAGTLPPDAKPLLITIGADVQGGENSRIECEVVAWGRDFESWSIDYHVIPGNTSDLDDACFTALRDIIKRKYSGMQPILSGIDAGYNSQVVYEFCDIFESGVHPVMGQDYLNRDKKYINPTECAGHKHSRIDVNDNLFKQEIYSFINKGKFEGGNVPRGYCHFPADYSRQHYIQLTNERRVAEHDKNGVMKIKWNQTGKNEQLDCRKYALAMVYAYREYIQIVLQNDGELDEEEALSWSEFWDYLEEHHI